MINRYTLASFVILLALIVGCSSGGGSAVTPELQSPQDSWRSTTNNTHLWGLWGVSLDPISGTAEIVPLRGAAFTTNVTQFMQPPIAPQHWMAIAIDPSTDFPSGYIVVDVSFTHPFPGLDMYTGFDVRGVCIGNGSSPGYTDGNILYAGPDDLRVLNADGLTRWFNPSEFTTYETIFGFTRGKLGSPGYDYSATLNAYKYYCDHLESQDDVTEFFTDPSCLNPSGMFSATRTRSL